MEFKNKLKEFFKYSEGTYYLITDVAGYNTVLRVDNVGFEAINAGTFIVKEIGLPESYSYAPKDDKVSFVINGKHYYLINYDDGVVSI
ncbi:hypothetical protein [Paenibacillus elgii]|uniref:hypothetical protein n=1 Tax=Paenibacillus elgii TaxID=189691 RepID=UPI000248D207|nr:hypothetical protein [Paenibacillus elgii]